MNYYEWLEKVYRKSNGEKLSDSSIKKYDTGLRIISNLMLKEKVIKKNLYYMNLTEFKIAINIIYNNYTFIIKNTVGHGMYSNALDKYEKYLKYNTNS